MTDHPREEEKIDKPEELKIKLIPAGDPKLGRIYSNYAQVSHNPFEFNIRFGIAPPGADIKKSIKEDGVTVEVPVLIDVMLVPGLIPSLIEALQTNFDKFMKRYQEKGIPVDSKTKTH